jgi:hypothetical protein
MRSISYKVLIREEGLASAHLERVSLELDKKIVP